MSNQDEKAESEPPGILLFLSEMMHLRMLHLNFLKLILRKEESPHQVPCSRTHLNYFQFWQEIHRMTLIS